VFYKIIFPSEIPAPIWLKEIDEEERKDTEKRIGG
jgi:hypothetical protein